ncbi:MAG: hypothetical protein A2W35_01430 [Chloroflexi bacterium RBG_16_57_11]|nr:MAG: hypothetical protein A2W35_01430 [Chloroflexi bacterium RBG_16_57_11]
MDNVSLTELQHVLVSQPLNRRIFLEGPAGAGKTTAAVDRLMRLLESGIPGESLLLLVPQRTLAGPYEAALRAPGAVAGGVVRALTAGGVARRMVDLFWPLVAGPAGFVKPEELPVFLTLETAQYYMAHLLRPLLEEGLFDSVVIDRNRLYSQVVDNLNKAAVVGFPYTEIGARLKAAWVGEPGQLRVYEDVQTAAEMFRRFCLVHNLLDFSLQVEVFRQHAWPLRECRVYLQTTYRHLIYDNIEEDTPFAHDLIGEWLKEFDSALLIFDLEAGYRRFLGADPESAYALKDRCEVNLALPDSLVMTAPIVGLGEALGAALHGERRPSQLPANLSDTLKFEYHRFFPQMLDWVTESIVDLVEGQGTSPGEIVVLAPYLSDALRFSLMERLRERGIPVRSHRPSRSLREEPATQCLLTLAALAHPEWGIRPSKFDVTYALMQAIHRLDLVRARLLAEIVYRERSGELSSFDLIRPETQERITYRMGERYERLRNWLSEASLRDDELDHFLSRLFGEVLSQTGFGFHASYDAGGVTANLIESVQKFRWVAGPMLEQAGTALGKEYLLMVQDGVIAAQYMGSWQTRPGEAVLLAPAYTFLMSNRPVEVQFWLDVGGRGWTERLYQPLTHPYVLSRNWEVGRLWGDADEVEAGREALYRLARGLLHRCRRAIYLGLSELGEQGYEQRGSLLMAFQRVLRGVPAPNPVDERVEGDGDE